MKRAIGVSDVNRINEALELFEGAVRGLNLTAGRPLREGDEDEGEDLEILDGDKPEDGEELEDGLDPDEDDDHCPPPGDGDCVDAALEAVMADLEMAGYSEETAEEAVYDAMAALVDGGTIPDTPDMVVEDAEKHSWISANIPKIKTKLKEMGLEF